MQFVVSKQNLQKELGFVQGVVEKKNTIPVLSNILIESVGESTIRITGTDLDVTIRCDMDADEITTPGSMCVQARKLLGSQERCGFSARRTPAQRRKFER